MRDESGELVATGASVCPPLRLPTAVPSMGSAHTPTRHRMHTTTAHHQQQRTPVQPPRHPRPTRPLPHSPATYQELLEVDALKHVGQPFGQRVDAELRDGQKFLGSDEALQMDGAAAEGLVVRLRRWQRRRWRVSPALLFRRLTAAAHPGRDCRHPAHLSAAIEGPEALVERLHLALRDCGMLGRRRWL